MSKFAQRITAELTGNRIASQERSNYTIEKSISENTTKLGIKQEIRIGAKFLATMYVDDVLQQSNFNPITEALKDARKAMVEEIFGEFRPIIKEMRLAVYDRDTNRIRTLLAELEERMFHEGL